MLLWLRFQMDVPNGKDARYHAVQNSAIQRLGRIPHRAAGVAGTLGLQVENVWTLLRRVRTVGRIKQRKYVSFRQGLTCTLKTGEGHGVSFQLVRQPSNQNGAVLIDTNDPEGLENRHAKINVSHHLER